MREILAHIEEDGRWLGLAIILWCGSRPSEARALRFYDFKAFDDHVERGYTHFCRSADEHGNEKPTMKNRFGPRAIVGHTELQHVVDLRMNFIRENLGIDDIGRFPAICFENNLDRACTAT